MDTAMAGLTDAIAIQEQALAALARARTSAEASGDGSGQRELDRRASDGRRLLDGLRDAASGMAQAASQLDR